MQMKTTKTCIIILGLLLFASNPFRDLWFYETVAANEGFGTTADAYIIGFAGQFMATVVFFPVGMFLIIYGISRANKLSLIPSFGQFSLVWGTLAILLGITMLLMEGSTLLYCLRYPHHWKTFLLTLAYVSFIYFWIISSLTHKKYKPNKSGLEDRLSPTPSP